MLIPNSVHGHVDRPRVVGLLLMKSQRPGVGKPQSSWPLVPTACTLREAQEALNSPC